MENLISNICNIRLHNFFLRYYCLLLIIFINEASYADVMSSSLKNPYIIYRNHPDAGFWSNFFSIMAGIDKADINGWIPVIDMERYPNFYNEKEPILGTMNSWEYFFKQPRNLNLDSALQMNYLSNEGGRDGYFTRAIVITPTKDKIERARYLIKKYIKIKKYIIDEVNNYIPKGMHDDILGVHVRGTDRRRGEINHLKTAEPFVYLEQAKLLDQTYQFSKIFLACDEPETIEMFLDFFGDRLIFTSAYRVSYSNLKKKKQDWLYDALRPQHRYKLGREVLVDALLLARTGHLLCGPSNVTHGAMFFSKRDQIIHEVASPGFCLKTLKAN